MLCGVLPGRYLRPRCQIGMSGRLLPVRIRSYMSKAKSDLSVSAAHFSRISPAGKVDFGRECVGGSCVSCSKCALRFDSLCESVCCGGTRSGVSLSSFYHDPSVFADIENLRRAIISCSALFACLRRNPAKSI